MVGPTSRAYVFNPPTRSLHHATTTKKVHEPGPTFYPFTSRDATCLPQGTQLRRFTPRIKILNMPTLGDKKITLCGGHICHSGLDLTQLSCFKYGVVSYAARDSRPLKKDKRRNIGFPKRPPLPKRIVRNKKNKISHFSF